tara:strand:- start:1552 stop:2286 length:735 start_codon:yes stop_codon:yes gene_type:complete
MPRIKQQELKVISEQMEVAKARSNIFSQLKGRVGIPDPECSDRIATEQCNSLIREMINRNFNIFDILHNYGKGAISSKNDTHSKGRKFEKFLGGRGDGDPTPDTNHSEIKLTKVDKKHTLPAKNPVLNIGSIQPRGKKYNTYEESSCYKKLERVLVCSYSGYGEKFEGTFIFEGTDPLWFARLKEDYEAILNEYKRRVKLGIRSSNSSVVSSTFKTPNGCLCVRSDSVMWTKEFFKEVSKHYDP